jgi:signal transduction histidine kinase
MTLASDQNINPEKLSPTARRMLELRDKVLSEWVKRVRNSIKEAEHLPNPIIINTFPALYDNLAEAITPDYPRATGNEGTTVAAEHGGERARLTSYNAHSVIAEYQQLRWTIFDVLKMNDVHLNDREIYIINASIDGSIRESVNAFALTQAALQERFVATLAHDLRNPLSNAYLAAQLIKSNSDLTKIKEFAEGIMSNLSRMDGMIRDLLDSIKFQMGEQLHLRLEEFDIQEVLKEVLDDFTAIHGARFPLISASIVGWWDREAIKRAVENIIGNAVKYGSPDTPVRIKIASQNERMLLSVHNEGESIPPEQIESIFQVFGRAEAAKKVTRKAGVLACRTCEALRRAMVEASRSIAHLIAAQPSR